MNRHAGRWAAFALLPASLGLALLALLAPMPTQPAARALDVPGHPATVFARSEQTATAAPTATVAIAVQLDTGRNLVRLVDFAQPISGLQALVQSGLDATIADAGFGPAICAIEGVGCPADDCFCNPDLFWNYSYWDGGAWQSYPVGAAESIIAAPGAIEGWRWGAFEDAQTAPAPAIAAATALHWLRSQQDPATGGFGGGAGSAVEVLLALGANEETPGAWRAGTEAPSLRDFLRTRATRYSRENVAAAGKLAVANAAASGCRTVRSRTPAAFLDADVDLLRARQRLQRLGHPGRSGAQRDRARHCRGDADRQAAAGRRLGVAGRLRQRHEHHRPRRPGPRRRRPAGGVRRGDQRPGFPQVRPDGGRRHRLRSGQARAWRGCQLDGLCDPGHSGRQARIRAAPSGR